MKHSLLVCCASTVCWLSFLVTVSTAEDVLPRWLAIDDEKVQTYELTHEVNFDEPVLSGKLKLVVDFARAAVIINDQHVHAVEPYCQLQIVDVTQWLKTGANQIRVTMQRVAGPSAMAFGLDIQLPSGRARGVQSDESWIASFEDRPVKLKVLERVRAEMLGAARRDISLSPVENYEQWRQALSEDEEGKSSRAEKVAQPKFWAAEGFQVQVLRTAADAEGSWISLTFDPEGRAIVSREDQGLLRLTLDADHETVERVEPIDVDLKECRGLAFHDGWLYANANNSKSLFRLKINAAGEAKELECLREFPGGVGHGRNDIIVDKDFLVTIHGDSVQVPSEEIADLTSPIRHLRGEPRTEGHVLRMHIPTRRWELFSGGLRNPYGLAVHPTGELFTFDADNEFDMGTPWYRPTRLVALAAGGDVGYRTAGNKMPPRFHDQPENVPPVLTIGRSSPTAVFHDSELTFPQPYRDALFLLDWTYGRVLAVHLEPHGAHWRAQAELFLQGRPLNVTDVARGRDGAMYLITGGRKTQSSLYRITAQTTSLERDQATDPNQATEPDQERDGAVCEHAADVDAFTRLQRGKRQRLEVMARQQDSKELSAVLRDLADADPAIRHASRIALERLPVDDWRSQVLSTPQKNTSSRLYGQLALAQASAVDDVPKLLDGWLEVVPSSLNLSETFVWVRICELMLKTDQAAIESKSDVIARHLVQAWPSPLQTSVAPEGTTVELRQRIAQLLGALAETDYVALIARDLLHSHRQEDQLAGLLALRHQRNGWTIAHRREQFALLRDGDAMIGGQGLPAFLAGIREDSLATLSDVEKAALIDVLERPSVTNDPVGEPSTRPLVQKWKTTELADLAQPQSAGNREKGALVYRDAMCGRCHRIGDQGKAIGPDLTLVGRRFSPRDLIASIIDPSHSVAENYRLDLIVTQSGNVYTGQILVEGDYRSEKLRIQTDALRLGSVIEIDKREIEEHRQLERSPMPDGLLDCFSKDEIRDLLAYLQQPQS